MIDTLTDEQKELLSLYRDKWIKIGLCTDPANRPEAERGIKLAYEVVNLPPPEIVWTTSPLATGLVVATKKPTFRASVVASVRASVVASVRDSVRASVWASVVASVRASVVDSVRDSVVASVRDSVVASVWDSVVASVWDSVVASVWSSVVASVWDSVRASGYGQHDAHWLAFSDYFAEVLNLKTETSPLEGLWTISKNAGWFLPLEKICFVSERHNICSLDSEGRIHSLTGPAVAYPDGFAVYAVHGVRVPSDIIETPSSITAKRIDDEQNAEIRRVMIDMFTPERYISESGAEKIHADTYGTLWRKRLRGDEDIYMVEVVNSTPEPDGTHKHYWLRVDPSAYDNQASQIAQAAVASTWRDDDGNMVFDDWRAYMPVFES